MPSGVATTEGQAHDVEFDGFTPICDYITAHVIRGPAHRVWPGAIPFGVIEEAAPVLASFGSPHRWKRLVFGGPRLGRSGLIRILLPMTKTAQVVSVVIPGCPISGLYLSNRTDR